jgi:hypothetical protein
VRGWRNGRPTRRGWQRPTARFSASHGRVVAWVVAAVRGVRKTIV